MNIMTMKREGKLSILGTIWLNMPSAQDVARRREVKKKLVAAHKRRKRDMKMLKALQG